MPKPHTQPAPDVVSSLALRWYPHSSIVVFNPCLQLDASGIAPFLPYVIRGDLNRLLDNDINTPSTLLVPVSLPELLTG